MAACGGVLAWLVCTVFACLMSSKAKCYTPGYQQLDLETLNFSLRLSCRLWCDSRSFALPPSSLILHFLIFTPPSSVLSCHFDFSLHPLPFLSYLSPPSHFLSCLLSFLFFLFIWLFLSLFLSLQGNTIESEHLSELTEEEYEAHIYQRQDLKGFMWLDAKYLNPFFTRRLTQEVREIKRQKSPMRPLCHTISFTISWTYFIVLSYWPRIKKQLYNK